MEDKIKRLKLLLKESGSDAILISSVPNIIYLTSYSGFSYFEREAFLIITNKENYLITDGRYAEIAADIPGFKLIETSSENTIDSVFENLGKKIKKIGVEENDLSVSEYRKIRKYFKTANLKNLQNLRIIKNDNEIKAIKKACRIADMAFDYILRKIKKGVTEKELAFEIGFFIKRGGGDISFPPIVAFSKNSSIPHHQSSNRKLKADNIVLLDFGVKFDNYYSDITRTVFFGKADDKFRKIYQTVLTAQQKAIHYINLVGRRHPTYEVRARETRVRDIDEVSRGHITKHGYPTIPHSLGHGIGIEVHEPPRLSPKSKDILRPGMVFSIEPGIYIPGYGGVRIEDLVLIKENKLEILTHSPKEIIEI